MDKLNDAGRTIIIDPIDPESEENAIAQIQTRLQHKQLWIKNASQDCIPQS